MTRVRALWARVRALWDRLLAESSSPGQLALAVFVGLFLGVVPLYGIQTGIVLFVAWALRLNRLAVLAAAQISIPPVAPFLIAAGIAIGEYVRFGRFHPPDLGEAQGFVQGLWLLGGGVPDLFLSCLIGDTLLGLVIASLGAAAAWVVASRNVEPATVPVPAPGTARSDAG